MTDRAPRKYHCIRHQDKASAYIAALRGRNWTRTSRPERSEFVLMDLDTGNREIVARQANEHGIPRFYYPHAARPAIYWDGVLDPIHPHAASFVQNEGSRQVLEAFGYPYPVHVTGWSMCKIRPRQKKIGGDTGPLRVLFGPIHPGYNRWLAPELLKANRWAYIKLLDLHYSGEIGLSVRHIESLHHNGLFAEPTVRSIATARQLETRDLDAFDVVVSHQTLAYLAIARGIPTLMFGEDLEPSSGNSEESFVRVASWPEYRDLLRYPLDLFDGDARSMLAAALRPDAAVERWRELFIGEPFDGTRFVDLIEGYL